MGWGRTLLLGDVGNRLDIADTERDIQRLRHALGQAWHQNEDQDARLQQLEREHAELKLCLSALLRLLASKGAIDLTELQALARAIDLEDGREDGR